MLEVAEFVREHGLDFAGVELAQQRVVEHHALAGAEAGEVGIGVRAARAAVHHEQALGREAAALHERRDARLERRVVQRLELVEQRRDEGRVDQHQQQVEAHPRAPGPEPPERAGRTHEPQDERRDRQPDQRAEQRRLDGVGEPELPGHLVEAEALLEPEGLPQRERQLQQAADERKGRQQRQLLHHAAAQPHQQQLVQQVEPAEQRPAQQQGGAPGHLDEPEACLGDGVVGGLLVRGERDGLCKSFRHGTAVARHVAHLAGGQPELHEQARHERRREGKGEDERIRHHEAASLVRGPWGCRPSTTILRCPNPLTRRPPQPPPP
ncbi:hypothetical protein D9M68_666380 [compost metagenome]